MTMHRHYRMMIIQVDPYMAHIGPVNIFINSVGLNFWRSQNIVAKLVKARNGEIYWMCDIVCEL